MQTINYDLVQLLRKIRAGHFVVPQFQRDFTWKEAQIRLLIDSIARNYPIGSLLVLGKNYEIPLKSRDINAVYNEQDNNEESLVEPTSETYYVLDGQQRLTSVARVFLDSHPKKNYYFDLKKMLEIFDDDSPSSSWIVNRLRGGKNPDRKDNNKLIRSDIVLIQKKSDVYVSEYIEDSGDFPEFKNNRNDAREAAAKIKGIFETIRNYSIPFVLLENDAPLESVCRVFETINSTGTRLTTFDLAVAKYFPDPDLKDLYDSSKEKYQVLSEFEVDGERVLQILSLYHLHLNDKFPEATRKVMLFLKSDFIKEHWESAVLNLSNAYKWIQGLGATPKTQPAHRLLVSVAAFLMVEPDSLDSNTELANVLNKWYFCSTLAKNPAPATNYKIGDDFRKFCEHKTQQRSVQYPAVYFTPEDIKEIKSYSDGRYKAIQYLMKMTAKKDLITGSILSDNDDVEYHNIFPSSLAKSDGVELKKLNSIANRIVLSKKSNKDISNTHTSLNQYLGERLEQHKSKGNIGDFNQQLRNCFIPYVDDPAFKDKLSQKNFDNFLSDRAKLIITRIKEVVGDAWEEPSADDNNESVNFVEDE